MPLKRSRIDGTGYPIQCLKMADFRQIVVGSQCHAQGGWVGSLIEGVENLVKVRGSPGSRRRLARIAVVSPAQFRFPSPLKTHPPIASSSTSRLFCTILEIRW